VAPGLTCVECGTSTDEFVRGWHGFLTDEEFEPAEVCILCPDCAEREFGQWQAQATSDDSDDSDES
jgi:hypothetical protein